jgi:hypothetical protein
MSPLDLLPDVVSDLTRCSRAGASPAAIKRITGAVLKLFRRASIPRSG